MEMAAPGGVQERRTRILGKDPRSDPLVCPVARRIANAQLPKQVSDVLIRSQTHEWTFIQSQKDEITLVLIVQGLKAGHLGTEWRAQPGPKVEYQRLLRREELGETDLLPVVHVL